MATIKVEVIGDSRKFRSDLANVESATSKAGGGLSKFAKLAAGAGLVLAGGMAVGLKKSLDAAGDFQSKMAVLQATTHGTNTQMAAASKLAIKLGADARLPAVSAGDAADAMLQLGKAGFSVQKAMKAARGTLLLATAAETDGATAAKVVTQNLNAFGLKASDTNKIVDEMAGFLNATGTEFDAFADSLTYTAAISHTVGQSFADTTTQLTILSQAGIEGSQAGTGLRTMLAGLGAEGSKASKTFAEVGVDTVNSSGKFVGMRAVIQKLTPVFAKMTSSQRLSFLQTAFGKTAMNQANIVLTESVAKYDAAKKAIERKGQADKLAAAHMQGYKGALAKLGSALETLEITMGTKFLPVATRVADFLAKVVSAPNISVAIHIVLAGIKDLATDLWKQISDALTGDTNRKAYIGTSLISFRNDGQGLASKFWQWAVTQIGTTPTRHVMVGGSIIDFKRDPTLRDRFTKWLAGEAAQVNWATVVKAIAIGLPSTAADFSRAVSKWGTKALEQGIQNISLENAKTALIAAGKLIAGSVIAWGKFFLSPLRGIFDVLGPQMLSGGERLATFLANGVKTAPAKLAGLAGDLIGKISGVVVSVASTAYGLAVSIGTRITDGAISGISGLASAIKDAAERQIKSGLSKLNPFSPVEHGGEIYIGKPIMDGAALGVMKNSVALAIKLAAAVRKAVLNAKSNVMASAGSLGDFVAQGIDAGASKGLAALNDPGGIGAQLAAITQQIEDAQNADQLASLTADLATAQAGGDPNEVKQAQKALDDWSLQQTQATLQAKLQAAQDKISQEADARKTAFQQGLNDLTDMLNRGKISQDTYNKDLQKLLSDSGQNYAVIGSELGTSFANGFLAALGTLKDQIATIVGSGLKTTGKTITTTGKGFHGFADGGIVKGGRGGVLGLIGEGRHDELIMPLDGRGVGGTQVTQNFYGTEGLDPGQLMSAAGWRLRMAVG